MILTDETRMLKENLLWQQKTMISLENRKMLN